VEQPITEQSFWGNITASRQTQLSVAAGTKGCRNRSHELFLSFSRKFSPTRDLIEEVMCWLTTGGAVDDIRKAFEFKQPQSRRHSTKVDRKVDRIKEDQVSTASGSQVSSSSKSAIPLIVYDISLPSPPPKAFTKTLSASIHKIYLDALRHSSVTAEQGKLVIPRHPLSALRAAVTIYNELFRLQQVEWCATNTKGFPLPKKLPVFVSVSSTCTVLLSLLLLSSSCALIMRWIDWRWL